MIIIIIRVSLITFSCLSSLNLYICRFFLYVTLAALALLVIVALQQTVFSSAVSVHLTCCDDLYTHSTICLMEKDLRWRIYNFIVLSRQISNNVHCLKPAFFNTFLLYSFRVKGWLAPSPRWRWAPKEMEILTSTGYLNRIWRPEHRRDDVEDTTQAPSYRVQNNTKLGYTIEYVHIFVYLAYWCAELLLFFRSIRYHLQNVVCWST